MKKMTMMAVAAFAAATAFAQADDLRANAANEAVQEILGEPDGVGLLRSEEDGSIQIFSRGTASYEFGDARDVRKQTKVAEMRAKAALAAFFKEHVSGATDFAAISSTALTQTKEGAVVKKSVSQEEAESMSETLSQNASAILSGVITLKSVKIPTEGSKTSGEVQVTVGISTKTIGAADEIQNMMTDSLNARHKYTGPGTAPDGAAKPGAKAGGAAAGNANDGANPNKPQVRVNKTLF